jgi:hypothetical protein
MALRLKWNMIFGVCFVEIPQCSALVHFKIPRDGVAYSSNQDGVDDQAVKYQLGSRHEPASSSTLTMYE